MTEKNDYKVPLNAEQKRLIEEASELVWKVERRFVRRWLTASIPLASARTYSQIAEDGIESVAFDVAGRFWVVVAGVEAFAVALPVYFIFLNSPRTVFAWPGFVLLAILVGIGFSRGVMSRREKKRNH
jgi:hypothetical protein